jgi:hypothetical protein
MLIEIEARIARGKLGVPEREPELAMMTIADLSERFLGEYDSPKIRNHDQVGEQRPGHTFVRFCVRSGLFRRRSSLLHRPRSCGTRWSAVEPPTPPPSVCPRSAASSPGLANSAS